MTGPSAQPQAQWIRAAISRFEGPLTLYVARLLGDTEPARDVVQEAFLRLCRQDRQHVEGHLAQWLYTVCRNCAMDLRRRGRGTVQMTGQEETAASPLPTPAEALELRESASDALRLLGSLTTNQQEVLRLKFQHGLSYKQIAQVTGLSIGNVGFLIHTGLKALRTQMTDNQERDGVST